MSIYIKKLSWKFILAVLGIVIVLVSFGYTHFLVKTLITKEQQKVHVWAASIQQRADLIHFAAKLFKDIQTEELKKALLYAEATKAISATNISIDYEFILKVLQDNTTVPVILENAQGELTARNLNADSINDTSYLKNQRSIMKLKYKPLEIQFYKNQKGYLYYNDSRLFTDIQRVFDQLILSFQKLAVSSSDTRVILTDINGKLISCSNSKDSTDFKNKSYLQKTISACSEQYPPILLNLENGTAYNVYFAEPHWIRNLRYFPFFQFAGIALFIAIAYLFFNTARKAEQNLVWVGMSKETAHQLGTPISSLMAWHENLKTTADHLVLQGMEQDLKRLTTISERFGKIGSQPQHQPLNLNVLLHETVLYLKPRSSKNIIYNIEIPQIPIFIMGTTALLDWVFENVIKNAIDAMNGKGTIGITLHNFNNQAVIEIMDTGKGIARKDFNRIFKPGYSSKTRGWGLGLSLSKRIIETYHKGKIDVKHSQVQKGTIMRIVLNTIKHEA